LNWRITGLLNFYGQFGKWEAFTFEGDRRLSWVGPMGGRFFKDWTRIMEELGVIGVAQFGWLGNFKVFKKEGLDLFG